MREFSTAKELVEELKRTKISLIKEKKIMDKKDKHIYPISSPFQIPKSWEWVFLSDISIIQEGPGIRKHQYVDDGIQFLTVTNILEGNVDLEKSQKYIGLEEYEQKYKHFTINIGDIVTACSGASWGKSAIYYEDDTLMLNTSTLRLRFFNDLGKNKYLYYITKTDYFKKNLSSHSTGQQANYGYSHYSKIPIPIPPLAEQKQIVSILDKAFAAIDQAKANIERNIENSKELFQSKLNEIFSQPARPSGGKGEGWEEKTLSEVCRYDKTKHNGEDLPYVGLEHIESNTGSYLGDLEPMKVKSSTFAFNSKHVLYGRLRPYLNKVLIPDFSGHCSTEIFPIITNELLKRRFLFYWFLAPITVQKIDATWTGARMPRANMNEVINFKISIPSIEIQTKLSKELDSLMQYSTQIENKYKSKLIILEELKKSILQKAFAGELTEKTINLGNLDSSAEHGRSIAAEPVSQYQTKN